MQLAHGDDGGGVAGIKLRYGEALEEGGMRGWQREKGGGGVRTLQRGRGGLRSMRQPAGGVRRL